MFVNGSPNSKQIVTASNPKAYTPTTQGMGTLSSVDLLYSRQGRFLKAEGVFTTGTVTAREIQLGLPTGLEIASDHQSAVHSGRVTTSSGSASTAKEFVVIATAGDTFINMSNVHYTIGLNPTVARTGTEILTSTRLHTISFTVPIEGWSTNTIQSEDIGNRNVLLIAEGNAGESLTANVTDIPFIAITDSAASWDGDQFTAQETGNYSFSGSIKLTAADTGYPQSYIDGTVSKTIGPAGVNASTKVFSGTEYLTKGQVWSIRFVTARTLSNNLPGHWLHIKKEAQPQTILETATVAARYSSNSGASVASGAPIIYEDIDYDTHNAYGSATGVYTVKISGKYLTICMMRPNAGVALTVSIEVNGTEKENTVKVDINKNYVKASGIFDLVKDDTVECTNGGGVAVTMEPVGVRNTFSIGRIK